MSLLTRKISFCNSSDDFKSLFTTNCNVCAAQAICSTLGNSSFNNFIAFIILEILSVVTDITLYSKFQLLIILTKDSQTFSAVCENKTYSKSNKDSFSSKFIEIHEHVIPIYFSWDLEVQKSVVKDTVIASVSNKIFNFCSIYW